MKNNTLEYEKQPFIIEKNVYSFNFERALWLKNVIDVFGNAFDCKLDFL